MLAVGCIAAPDYSSVYVCMHVLLAYCQCSRAMHSLLTLQSGMMSVGLTDDYGAC